MLVKVKVYPDSKKEKIVAKDYNHLEVWIKEKAQHGQANQALRQLLASHFQIPTNKVSIKKGLHRPNKIFKIYN